VRSVLSACAGNHQGFSPEKRWRPDVSRARVAWKARQWGWHERVVDFLDVHLLAVFERVWRVETIQSSGLRPLSTSRLVP